MMHGHEKSDPAIVAVKPANKVEHALLQSDLRRKLNQALGRNSLLRPCHKLQSGVLKEPRSNLAYSHQANERPRCRRRAASLTSFHSLRVGNAGGRLVWNVRTCHASSRRLFHHRAS